MTHRLFPHIPAGAAVQEADSSHMASGSFSRPTGEPPGQRHGDNDIKTSNSNNSICLCVIAARSSRGCLAVRFDCESEMCCPGNLYSNYQPFQKNLKWKKQNKLVVVVHCFFSPQGRKSTSNINQH